MNGEYHREVDIAHATEERPKLQQREGKFTGRTLYSYDGAYWFNSPESAWEAFKKLHPQRSDSND